MAACSHEEGAGAAAGALPDADGAARLLTGGGYRALADRVPSDALRAAYAAGLDRVFLASAVLAAAAGVATLLLLRTPGAGDPVGEPITNQEAPHPEPHLA